MAGTARDHPPRRRDLVSVRSPLPSSTLFPYTTLFRSLFLGNLSIEILECDEPLRGLHQVQPPRSEEHTSELQSLRHLVCRLLLEQNTSDGGTARGGASRRRALAVRAEVGRLSRRARKRWRRARALEPQRAAAASLFP